MRLISKLFKNEKPVINVIRMNGVIASGSKFPGSSNLSLESLEKQIERAFSGKKIAMNMAYFIDGKVALKQDAKMKVFIFYYLLFLVCS